MNRKIIQIPLTPDKDIIRLQEGAIPRGTFIDGENIVAVFEIDPAAPLKPADLAYVSLEEDFEAEGFQFVGMVVFQTPILTYVRI